MKVEEAKEKWCPFARDTDREINVSASWNRINGKPTERTLCIADKCMAWRVVYLVPDEGYQSEPVGYCGLAGKPQ